jgi:5-methylthioadenosine/S-adenosylhomocysteine deaminase
MVLIMQDCLLCRAEYLLPLVSAESDERIRDGYVLSVGDTIVEVGRYTEEIGQRLREQYGERLKVFGCTDANAEIPCQRAVLLPAFVKAHGHDHEQPIIGVAKDEPLTAWLDHAVNPFTAFINNNHEQLCLALGASPYTITYRMARLCDIHYGITSCMVHHCGFNKYRVSEIAAVNEVAGTTMIVAIGSQNRYYISELIDSPIEVLRRLDEANMISGLKRTTFCPGPDQVFSNSRELLVPQKEWARMHGTVFHIHSAEEPATTRMFIEEIEPGLTEIEFLDSIGVLDSKTIIAHQVNCGEHDVELLARSKAAIVHNPLANAILGSGMPPIMQMINAGIPVAISTDGSGSADNQNIIAAVRLAAQYQKAYHQNATLLPSGQLLRMITSIPAELLGLKQGMLVPGYAADWVLLNLERPNLVPTRLDNVVENIIWAADGSEIDSVVARGRILKEHGRIAPFLDGITPEQIMRDVAKLAELFVEYRKTAPELRGTGAHK